MAPHCLYRTLLSLGVLVILNKPVIAIAIQNKRAGELARGTEELSWHHGDSTLDKRQLPGSTRDPDDSDSNFLVNDPPREFRHQSLTRAVQNRYMCEQHVWAVRLLLCGDVCILQFTHEEDLLITIISGACIRDTQSKYCTYQQAQLAACQANPPNSGCGGLESSVPLCSDQV
jgi:hypothetical protein